jgi:hypothetical protein
MNIKEWIKENVNLKRKETEVRDYKGYGFTLAAVGLAGGAATAIIVVIMQTFLSSIAASDTILNVITAAIVLALLGYLVWLLLPMLKDSCISIGSKVLTCVISLACLAVPFVIGVYLIVLAFIVLVGLAAIWVMGKLWSASEKADKEDADMIDTMLGLGGKLKDDSDTIVSGGGTLHGTRIDKDTFHANGTTYKRTYDGFSEVWKEE